ncbi:MAG: GAF domain-containing protein [Deltaproteobacteria bacterium]|nr:GAF domain-containing protein [Deltaproteobacteria bacterium]
MLINKKYISVKVNNEALKTRNEGLALLFKMGNYLSTPLTMKGLLAGALSRVLAHFDLEAGRVYLLNETGQYLDLVAHEGMPPRGLERVSINEGFSGKAARTQSFIAQHVSDLEDRERAALLSGKGFNIVLCVPLITRNRVRGVMNLATNKDFQLDQDTIDLLTIVGNQIAVAADNARLYADLEAKIEAVREKKDVIKFFAYSVSHDLKSPAVALYALTKRLNEKYAHGLDKKGKEHCRQILRTAAQMAALVEKLNGYIVAKEAPFNFERISAKAMIRTIRGEFSDRLKQHQVRWSVSDDLPKIVADRSALLSVFRNLVDNTLKYGGEDLSEIKIGCEENETHHIFFLNDDGVGIKSKDRGKIFDLFQRNETSVGTAGSGLGLAIAKEISKRHQGHIWLDVAAGKGTKFCISISKRLEPNGQAAASLT